MNASFSQRMNNNDQLLSMRELLSQEDTYDYPGEQSISPVRFQKLSEEDRRDLTRSFQKRKFFTNPFLSFIEDHMLLSLLAPIIISVVLGVVSEGIDSDIASGFTTFGMHALAIVVFPVYSITAIYVMIRSKILKL